MRERGKGGGGEGGGRKISGAVNTCYVTVAGMTKINIPLPLLTVSCWMNSDLMQSESHITSYIHIYYIYKYRFIYS